MNVRERNGAMSASERLAAHPARTYITEHMAAIYCGSYPEQANRLLDDYDALDGLVVLDGEEAEVTGG